MMTLGNAGAMLGIAVFGTIAMHGFPGRVTGHSLQVPAPAQLVPGFQAAFLTGVVVCLIVAVVSVFVQERRGSKPAP